MRYQILASITLGLALILSSPVAGQTQSSVSEDSKSPAPLTIPFDGMLPDHTIGIGAETGNDQELVFRVYDQQTGGNLLFEERQTPHITNSSYSVLIGAATPGGIPADILHSDSVLWIEASVGSAPFEDTRRVLATAGMNANLEWPDSSESVERSETAATADPKAASSPVYFQLQANDTMSCLRDNVDQADTGYCDPKITSETWHEFYRIGRTGGIKIHLQNPSTGHCLEEDNLYYNKMKMEPCDPHKAFQTWRTRAVTGYGSFVTFQNEATHRCLAADRYSGALRMGAVEYLGHCSQPDLHLNLTEWWKRDRPDY
jgi:hypothetical protein